MHSEMKNCGIYTVSHYFMQLGHSECYSLCFKFINKNTTTKAIGKISEHSCRRKQLYKKLSAVEDEAVDSIIISLYVLSFFCY